MTESRRWLARASLLVALVAFCAPSAGAQDVPFVDGPMWKDTAAPLKRAYLVGVANTLSAEYAFQKKQGFPSDDKSSIRLVYEGIDDVTLDQCIERIDRWYKQNPDKPTTPVLEVIWLEMVEPNVK
jgi:hypothetical protein